MANQLKSIKTTDETGSKTENSEFTYHFLYADYGLKTVWDAFNSTKNFIKF